MGQSKQLQHKHLGGEVRKPEVLLCYHYDNGITYEEEYIIFATKPNLFSIRTIVYLRQFNM